MNSSRSPTGVRGPTASETRTPQAGRRGRLFVVSGPSGVGKSTVLHRLREALPNLWYSVSATTRVPRPGEVDGIHYLFVDPEVFSGMVQAGDLLEHAYFAGHHYGTPREPVERRLAAGRDVLLEIDVQGARQVRAATGLGPEAIMVFLAPPSYDELARRLVGRGTESAATAAARLAAARDELAAEPEFDHTVVNSDVDAATAGLVALMVGRRSEDHPDDEVRPD